MSADALKLKPELSASPDRQPPDGKIPHRLVLAGKSPDRQAPDRKIKVPGMVVFRHATSLRTVEELTARCRRAMEARAEAEWGLELLLAASGLECALADAWGARLDGRTPGHVAALEFAATAAEAYLGARGASARARLARAWRELEPRLPPPWTVLTTRDPEGFRYYGLTPEAYRAPAEALAAHARGAERLAGDARRPIFVLGLRTIGSALGAVVTAAVRATGLVAAWATLRPRGAPEDRHYAADAALRQGLRCWRGLFAVVDEGPGLSGSSFGGAVQWLERLGAAPERIALLPSWNPPACRLSHTEVAQSWDSWQKFPASAPEPTPAAAGDDLSAGQWRRRLRAPPRIPVWPQRERAKRLSHDGRWIFKFGGLGGYGREAAERARVLARAGFTPPAEYLGGGWLRMPRRRGQILDAAFTGTRAWAEWAGRYLAFVRSRFVLGPRQPPARDLRVMARANLARLLRREFPSPPPEGVPVRLDARLHRHEWAETTAGWIKFDALDHGDDHFFPGPADIAWDLAALEFEFGVAAGRAAREEYIRRSGDRDLPARLPWYRLAYGAQQAAFAEFARELVGSPDREWFCATRDRYLDHVRRLLHAPGTAPTPGGGR